MGVAAADARAPFRSLGTWGAGGVAPGQFNVPNGIAVDAMGHVYVADQNNHRVQKFSASGRLLAVIGTEGTGPGQFRAPYGVAVDGFGDLFVVDALNNNVQKLSPTGRFLARWGAHGGDGTPGTGDGEFSDPRGLAVDDLGDVYVADHGNNRVVKLSPTGRFLARWGAHGGDGTPGAGNGEFDQPRGIAIDHAGHVYVVEKRNHRVQELAADGSFIRRWGAQGGNGTPGAGNGEFNLPYNVAIDRAGRLFVTDVLNNRIQEFSATGRFIARFGRNGGDGTAGGGAGEFAEPYGVATDCLGRVYVTEEGNARVQVLGGDRGVVPRCPPVLAVTAARSQRAAGSRLRVTIRCDRPCTATASATIAVAGRRAMRARAVRRSDVMPGRAARVRLRLRRADAGAIAAALRAGARVRARVTVRATGFAGRARTVRRAVAVV